MTLNNICITCLLLFCSAATALYVVATTAFICYCCHCFYMLFLSPSNFKVPKFCESFKFKGSQTLQGATKVYPLPTLLYGVINSHFRFVSVSQKFFKFYGILRTLLKNFINVNNFKTWLVLLVHIFLGRLKFDVRLNCNLPLLLSMPLMHKL